MPLHLRLLPPPLHRHPPTTLASLASLLPLTPHRLASHATQATGNQKKNGPGKRLGAKKASTELVVPGNIIFRQRGTLWFPGDGCGIGRDHTIFAREKGYVVYYSSNLVQRKGRRYIGIVAERGMTLPRLPTQPRRRLLGRVSRAFGDEPASSPSAAADTVAEPPALVPLPPLAAVPSPSQLRKLGRRQYLRRETNWEIGRVNEGVEVAIKPFRKVKRPSKRRKRIVWKRLGKAGMKGMGAGGGTKKLA